jgi:hypothetical protein
MRCVLSPLGRHSGATPTLLMALLGLGLSVLGTGACSVDDGGLDSTIPKLNRDGGGTGGSVATTDGAGQDLASNGGAGGMGGGTTGGIGGKAVITGAAGTNGVAGTNGAAGTNGLAGSNGAAGTNGTAGTNGLAGTNGAAGTNGIAGSGGVGGSAGRGGAGGSAGGSVGGNGGVNGGTGGRGGVGGTAGGMGGRGGFCTPNNCADGCCANNQCVHNKSAQQCGTMGASCTPCAPCSLCSANGQCAIDPASRWTIVADSVQAAMAPPGGGTWDPPQGDEGGAAPDLFCEYDMPGMDINMMTAGVTSTVVDVFTANWDQVITPSGMTVGASALMAANPAWRIWVGDEDCNSPGNCTATGADRRGPICSYQQGIPATALLSGQLKLSNFQGCVSLTLSFVCQSPAKGAGP